MFSRFLIIQHQQGKIVNCPKSNKNNRITYYTGEEINLLSCQCVYGQNSLSESPYKSFLSLTK